MINTTFKVGIFTGSNLLSFGGGERYAIELSNELIKNGKDTIIFTQDNNLNVTITLSDARKMCHAKIIQFRTLFPKLFPTIPLFTRKAFIELNRVDTIYNIDESLFLNIFLMIYSKIKGKKYIYGMHIPQSFLFGNKSAQTKFKKMIWHLYKIPMLAFFRQFVSNIHIINSEQKKQLQSIKFPGNIYLIPNFVFINKENIEFNSSEFIILFTAVLSIEMKGADLLSEIIEKTIENEKNIKFYITGRPDNGVKLITKLVEKYPDNVIYYGFVSESKLAKYLEVASLSIVTSRIETFPLVIVLAQSYGLPVIAFDIPGPSDILKKDYQGSLIPAFDVCLFSKSILKYYNSWKINNNKFFLLRKDIQKNIYEKYGKNIIIPELINMLNPLRTD